MSSNPWIEQHIAAETDLGFGHLPRATARRAAKEAVMMEYGGREHDTLPCECGGTAWLKATVGCFKCAACGKLYHSSGKAVGS